MTELLAPAGDSECFKAALCAGADAIYVGGKKFGARAYAGNFEQEDLIASLKLAHLHAKKVYLTVNTLMKEQELMELPSFIQPLYEEGLDGVIVQDLGALLLLREAFPGLDLHASTQMTVTGRYGAGLLKEYGVTRVVPARELSLREIVDMKEKTGLEIETFVHGAMCYGYSGQCLFSSMLGERSGNRGRCAGPCRLPYDVLYQGRMLNTKEEKYPLSLKDLCTLDVLPQLIEAGIDSFKIEGRMKTPEYVAFVTGMYRKYMDFYESNPENYRVSENDRKQLQKRFSRGGMQAGYYFTHNGRELVTLDKPGYSESTADIVPTEIKPIDLCGQLVAIKGEPVYFTVYKEGQPQTTVVSTGNVVCEAAKCAATCEDVKQRLCKTGNTPFAFRHLDITMDDDVFLPNKELNELRRNALAQVEDVLLAPYQRTAPDCVLRGAKKRERFTPLKARERYLHVEVRTWKQLEAVSELPMLSGVYVSSDSMTALPEEEKRSVAEHMMSKIQQLRENGTGFYITLPPVCRQKTMKILEQHRNIFEKLSPDGFCVGNLETLSYVKQYFPKAEIIAGPGLYLFNTTTTAFYEQNNVRTHILSCELHRKEIAALTEDISSTTHAFVLPVYGYLPVIESAGCLLKTMGKCRGGKGEETVVLTDRHKKQRVVLTHCDRCENTIYNSVPLSLHKEMEQIKDMNLDGIMLKFTLETAEEVKHVMSCFVRGNVPVSDFTKGHFMKGVE